LAVKSGTAQITLEPGGQVELSGSPFTNLFDLHRELRRHLETLVAVGAELGIGFSSLGFHPNRKPLDIEFVPKPRYRVMREYFQRSGRRGLHMMACTATVQTNLDFSSEAEAMHKFRAAQLASPYVSAIFNNSPFEEGTLTEWQSRRYMTWLDVDRKRTGLLDFGYDASATYQDYVEWALDAPLYGFSREERFYPCTNQTFRDFLEQGISGYHPTHEDWLTHLGSLYPEVRLKRTIELRGVDSGGLHHAMGSVGMWRGLLDSAASRRAIISQLEKPEDTRAFQAEIARRGLCAEDADGQILPKCRWLTDLARRGLYELSDPLADTVLEPVFAALDQGLCPADEWRQDGLAHSSTHDILMRSVYLAKSPAFTRTR
jgi:glutamate--cysteine ligase